MFPRTGCIAARRPRAERARSNPAWVAWDFGDGGSAAGASTPHVYAAAGSSVVS